jgi:hypothetical protein
MLTPLLRNSFSTYSRWAFHSGFSRSWERTSTQRPKFTTRCANEQNREWDLTSTQSLESGAESLRKEAGAPRGPQSVSSSRRLELDAALFHLSLTERMPKRVEQLISQDGFTLSIEDIVDSLLRVPVYCVQYTISEALVCA